MLVRDVKLAEEYDVRIISCKLSNAISGKLSLEVDLYITKDSVTEENSVKCLIERHAESIGISTVLKDPLAYIATAKFEGLSDIGTLVVEADCIVEGKERRIVFYSPAAFQLMSSDTFLEEYDFSTELDTYYTVE